MAFRPTRRPTLSTESPEALFRDLRNRQVEGLLAHQADMLRAYHPQAVDTPDVALQLPTGSGKTLVGLLIGEWRRRKYQERVVYLCPTRQLVNQVVEQAKGKYGIKPLAFTGPQAQYSPASKAEYLSADALAVTTYSGLFNVNPFFSDAHIIILDDVHTAENYITGYWSLFIESHNQAQQALFDSLASILRSILSPLDYSHLCGIPEDFWDYQWADKLPTPTFYELIPEITTVIDANITNVPNLSYRWQAIRDHLYACHLYLGSRRILIRPLIPPTRTHPPFANARQRIYMSATFGEAGELERLTGTDRLIRLPVPEGWDKQGIGRRLICFPERSLEKDEALALTVEMMKCTPRTLVLTPSDREAKEVRTLVSTSLGYPLFDATQMEDSKTPFVQSPNAVAVVANRYDGIDLIGDECRLLILHGLPKATNLQEQFLISRCGSAIVYTDRILTRFVQAAGRCTRSATDYAAVVILGEDFNKFLLPPDKRAHLHPEIQGELDFGIENSKDITKEVFLENLRIFLEHQSDWDVADAEIVSFRDETTRKPLPGADALSKSVPHEVRYQYNLWKGDYEGAVEECRKVLAHLSGDELKGYRSFWNYLAGSAAWLAYQEGIQQMAQVARDFFSRASSISAIRWLVSLSRIGLAPQPETRTDPQLMRVIERLEKRLERLGTANDINFDKEITRILTGLASDLDAKTFEAAHTLLGQFLGYEAGNDESSGAPDPWWIPDADLCIIFEDHSQAKEDSPIGSSKVRQASTHPNWVRDRLPVSPDAQILPVLVTPCRTVEKDALPHAANLSYWNLEQFRQWTEKAIGVIRKLRRSFPGIGDLAWQAEAITAYTDNGLDPHGLVEMLKSKKVTDLPGV